MSAQHPLAQRIGKMVKLPKAYGSVPAGDHRVEATWWSMGPDDPWPGEPRFQVAGYPDVHGIPVSALEGKP